MKRMCSNQPRAAILAVFAISLFFSPTGAGAIERRVPEDFATIQAAITAAGPGDSVVVGPGTYQEAVTLKDGVSVRGRETARTFLSGGSGPAIVSNGSVSASVLNFTFIDSGLGIRVTDNTSRLRIANNVFDLGPAAAAIFVQNAPLTEIVNNVFSKNGAAITRDSDIKIVNNIFSDNGTAIAGPAAPAANILNNAFFGAGADASPRGAFPVPQDINNPEPFFVDPAKRDFHLELGSALKDKGAASAGSDFDGTPADLGAYGGPDADPTPFPVQGLTITAFTESSIDLEWLPNNSYLIDDPGGYRLYYGRSSGVYNGTEAPDGPSPIDVPVDAASETQSFSLLGLPTPATPEAPVLFPPAPRNGALVLSWSAAPGAIGYKVHYGETSTDENTLDAGNATTYTLTGLTNGRNYRVAVSSYVPSSLYFIAVTAVDSTAARHESAFSQEVSVQLGGSPESGLSNVQVEFPDSGQPYPSLPGGRQGCFIATAAYGDYGAPEVAALRAFRDRYLLTTAFGRRFVEWYYRHSPAAAAKLNAHPGYKPLVRAALMPLAAAAALLTGAPTAIKAGALIFLGSAAAFGFSVRRRGPAK